MRDNEIQSLLAEIRSATLDSDGLIESYSRAKAAQLEVDVTRSKRTSNRKTALRASRPIDRGYLVGRAMRAGEAKVKYSGATPPRFGEVCQR